MVYEYEVLKETGNKILKVNYEGSTYTPSIEDDRNCMARIFNLILEVGKVNSVSLMQREEYVYDYEQIKLINELTDVYTYLVKEENIMDFLSLDIPSTCSKYFPSWHAFLRQVVLHELKGDPVGAYVNLVRRFREEEAKQKSSVAYDYITCSQNFAQVLKKITDALSQTELIRQVEKGLPGHKPGDRAIYREIFRPSIRPYFMYTKIVTAYPANAEELASYRIGKDTEVMVLRHPDDIRPLYHMIPPEFKLTEEKYDLLTTAREVMAEHHPQRTEFMDIERTRETFLSVEKDLLEDLAKSKGMRLKYKEIEELAEILLRYTIGFGLVEVLLADPKIQDIVVNAPIGASPISIIHADFGECRTNITPLPKEAESWATKLRLISGRPFDEANPVLDTNIAVPGGRARVAVIQQPLSPSGLAYAFRRHRDKPWTLPLFINEKMLSPLAAGVISFLVDGARTILVAGTRSAGKCLNGDTLIQLANGEIKEIRDLIRGEPHVVDDRLVYEDTNGPNVLTLQSYKTKQAKLGAYWKRAAPHKLIRIKTKSGKEIVTTPEHPYFVFDKGLKSQFAEHITPKTLIATPRKITTSSEKVEFKLDGIDRGEFYLLKGKTNSIEIKFPKVLTPELAELVGFIIGDGHIDLHKVEFTNSNQILRERVKDLLYELFRVKSREFKSRNTFNLQATARALSHALNRNLSIPLGNKASTIQIPQAILKSENKILAAFLRAYFDCDGYVSKSIREVELATASPKMARQLQLVLLRFGIVAFLKEKAVKGKIYYRILIRGPFVDVFAREIGFSHPEKSATLEKILGRTWLDNTNADVIPQGDYFVKELRKRLRVTSKQLRKATGKDPWAYEHKAYRVSRKWFERLIALFDAHYNQLRAEEDKFEKLRTFVRLESNLDNFIDKLVELKKSSKISYTKLANTVELSEAGLRKILRVRNRPCVEAVQHLMQLPANLNFEQLDRDVNYEELARQTQIPTTSIKSYVYGGVTPPEERAEALNTAIQSQQRDILSSTQRSHSIIDELSEFANSFKVDLVDRKALATILFEARNLLNIQDKELVSHKASIGSVSNFFTHRYKTSLGTLSQIAKNILDIYAGAVSSETDELLKLAKDLANSEIFWDEISEVSHVEPTEPWVYDLTVDRTHNFIASGIFAHNTSLLGALLVEISRNNRVLSVEDTLELPIAQLRGLGYDILSMKTRSVITGAEAEVPAEQAIRTALRLGDSALIVGEVRSLEAKALWEAMRVGALAKVVAGTIHGDSPYGVFDRVVNDLGVPKTSFKATDIILVANPVISPSGLISQRRLVEIAEVRKFWTDDPLKERGFADLFVYNPKTDILEPTDVLLEGESEILKQIGGRVKEWAGNWDAIWENIQLRAKVKQAIVDTANEQNDPELMEAEFVVKANDEFHRITDLVIQDVGKAEPDRIFSEWKHWLKRQVEGRKDAKEGAG